MFQKLRLQLTILCTTVTALILAVLTVICLFISESGIRRQEEASFQTNLNTLYQNLQQQTTISHSWIRQMEYNYQFSLRLRDNGVLLFYQNFPTEEERETLLNLAEERADSEYGYDMETRKAAQSYIQHQEFALEDSRGNTVNASVALISRYGGTLGVTVVHPLTQVNRQIATQRKTFLLADLAALLILTVFFWFFINRMLKPLQENRRKQTQFIASASHELRSPLTVILSNVDAVRSGSMPGDEQFLNTITEEGQRMSRLISDMLQLASADNHSWSIQPRETEADTLLLQTWESFESMARARNLQWEIRLPDEEVPRCFCDPERIRQLLSILIDNAFCYTPAGGKVSLSLEQAASALRITVADNGPGIPDEQKAAVFERFYCIDASHNKKAHFGLGLCIAQEIARLHKGQILLTDTPGGGAAFTVVLPLNRG